MPTRSVLASFLRDWQSLTPQQQRQFLTALKQFITDLREPQPTFHPQLRVKRMQGHPSIWEMTWAPDGRATFEYATRFTPASRTSSGGGSARTRSSNGPDADGRFGHLRSTPGQQHARRQGKTAETLNRAIPLLKRNHRPAANPGKLPGEITIRVSGVRVPPPALNGEPNLKWLSGHNSASFRDRDRRSASVAARDTASVKAARASSVRPTRRRSSARVDGR
jgi:hypothetical protein